MGVYLVFLIILVISSIVELLLHNNKNIISYFYILVVILFVCIGGLTKGNGLDWGAYESIAYEGISVNDALHNPQFEPLFLLLYNLFPTFHSFLFVFVVINLVLLSKTIVKCSPYVIISIFVYVCVYYFLGIMGQLRQALAISIIVFAWPYMNSKKFIIYLLLASLFHYSAMICLLYFFVPNKLFSKWVYVLLLLILFASFDYFKVVIMNALGGFSYGKISYYLAVEEGGISFSFFLYKVFVFILLFLNVEKISTYLPKYKILNLYFISILLYLLLSFSSSIGGRIILYFSIFEILVIPFIIKAYNRYILKFSISLFLIFLNIYQYLSFLYSYADIFLPYKFVFL